MFVLDQILPPYFTASTILEAASNLLVIRLVDSWHDGTVIVAIGAAARGHMQTRVSATGIPFHVSLLLTRPLMHLAN